MSNSTSSRQLILLLLPPSLLFLHVFYFIVFFLFFAFPIIEVRHGAKWKFLYAAESESVCHHFPVEVTRLLQTWGQSVVPSAALTTPSLLGKSLNYPESITANSHFAANHLWLGLWQVLATAWHCEGRTAKAIGWAANNWLRESVLIKGAGDIWNGPIYVPTSIIQMASTELD